MPTATMILLASDQSDQPNPQLVIVYVLMGLGALALIGLSVTLHLQHKDQKGPGPRRRITLDAKTTGHQVRNYHSGDLPLPRMGRHRSGGSGSTSRSTPAKPQCTRGSVTRPRRPHSAGYRTTTQPG